jgi:hypothetical protein
LGARDGVALALLILMIRAQVRLELANLFV